MNEDANTSEEATMMERLKRGIRLGAVLVLAAIVSSPVAGYGEEDDGEPITYGSEVIEIVQCVMEGPHFVNVDGAGNSSYHCVAGFEPVAIEDPAAWQCLYECVPEDDPSCLLEGACEPVEPDPSDPDPPDPSPEPLPEDPVEACQQELQECLARADGVFYACMHNAHERADSKCLDYEFPDGSRNPIVCTSFYGKQVCKFQLDKVTFSEVWEEGGIQGLSDVSTFDGFVNFCKGRWLNPQTTIHSGLGGEVNVPGGAITLPGRDKLKSQYSPFSYETCRDLRKDQYKSCLADHVCYL